MACKHCHPKKETTSDFVVGRRYMSVWGREEHICAQVEGTLGSERYALISLVDGNRWAEPTKNLQDVAKPGEMTPIE